MNKILNENLLQSVFEVAKNGSLSFSIEGWPAATAVISISIAAVLMYKIKVSAGIV